MNSEEFLGDLLVIDYTEYHKRHPEEKVPSDGVHFTTQPDNRLGAFCILNPNKLPFEAINLEANPQLVTDEHGQPVKQCECICRAQREEGKRWVLLLELKYCAEKNIPENMQNAFKKLEKCHDFLDRQRYFSDNLYRIYWAISHPEHDTVQPFENFINDQDRVLGLNEKHIKLLYCNTIRILTTEYLDKAKMPQRYQSTQP